MTLPLQQGVRSAVALIKRLGMSELVVPSVEKGEEKTVHTDIRVFPDGTTLVHGSKIDRRTLKKNDWMTLGEWLNHKWLK